VRVSERLRSITLEQECVKMGLCARANVSEFERMPVSAIERIASVLNRRVHNFIFYFKKKNKANKQKKYTNNKNKIFYTNNKN
jgi:hypothetical protein